MFSLYHNMKRLKEDVNSNGVLKGERRRGAYLYPTHDKQWLAAQPGRGDLVHVVLDAQDPMGSLTRMGVPEGVAARIMKRVALIGDSKLHDNDAQTFATAIWAHNLPKPTRVRDHYRRLDPDEIPKEQLDLLKSLHVPCGDPLITTPEGLTICISTTLILDGKGHGDTPQLYSTMGFKFTKRSIVITEDLEHATCAIVRHCRNHGKRLVSSFDKHHNVDVDIYY